MNDYDFKQKLAIALAGNPEFVKATVDNYDHKQPWFCFSEQVSAAVNNTNIKKSPED